MQNEHDPTSCVLTLGRRGQVTTTDITGSPAGGARMLAVFSLLATVALYGIAAVAQETRGTLHGRVLDPSGAAVAGIPVVVENVDMNTAAHLTTNQTGYYEATLLLPGSYRVSAEAAGFKKTVRSGLVLPMGASLDIDLVLEVGGVSETVSVTAQASVLETSAVSSGRVLENRSVMDLPTIANNTMVLVKMSPGLFSGGVNDYLGPHSIVLMARCIAANDGFDTTRLYRESWLRHRNLAGVDYQKKDSRYVEGVETLIKTNEFSLCVDKTVSLPEINGLRARLSSANIPSAADLSIDISIAACTTQAL